MRLVWTDGTSAPWYAIIFGPITMLAFIVLTVLVVGVESHGGWDGFPWRAHGTRQSCAGWHRSAWHLGRRSAWWGNADTRRTSLLRPAAATRCV